MLGLDQDLEAELGIDSIKRVEILGAFQKRMPGVAAETMQGGMERYTRAKTLNAILAQASLDLASLSPAAAAAPAVIVTAAPISVQVAAPAMDRAALQLQLLNIVAERTGYPTDMLGLEQELEAELGIDSIKRVEILGAMQKALPAAASEAMQSGMEQFTKARSLNAILDAAMALAPAAAAVAAAPAAVTFAAPAAVASPQRRRWIAPRCKSSCSTSWPSAPATRPTCLASIRISKPNSASTRSSAKRFSAPCRRPCPPPPRKRCRRTWSSSPRHAASTPSSMPPWPWLPLRSQGPHQPRSPMPRPPPPWRQHRRWIAPRSRGTC